MQARIEHGKASAGATKAMLGLVQYSLSAG
jgi:hypothetical protein